MIKRNFMHIYLMLMFAFAQAGIIAHDISHYEAHQSVANVLIDQSSEQNQESDLAEECCVHCIAFEQSSHATPTTDFQFTAVEGSLHFATVSVARLVSRLAPTNSARAPPISLS